MQKIKLVSLVVIASLSGCASLPSSGPSGKQIMQGFKDPESTLPVQLVELSSVADLPVAEAKPSTSPLPSLLPPPTDMIGPGDVLDVTIYEAGVALFSGATGGAGGGQAASASVNPGVQAQKLPPSRVDDNGDIVIPYAGKLRVMGRTVGEVESQIQRALRGLSQNPRVVVTLSQSITNSVIVSGEVNRPGRLVLQTNRETLSDVVALAGGYRGNAKDLTLRVVRQNRNVDVRYNDLVDNPLLDVAAYPGDRLMLISSPRFFSVLGASGKVDHIPFARTRMSLAEAIAAAGGVNANSGDPKAIFVFRQNPEAGEDAKPVVYHLNMMQPGSYILAQRFTIDDRDTLYFGNAAANQPGKLLQLVSQLFTPLVTVTAAVQTLQN
ncbi:polysaccharide biosynthesis/export family protein [Novosphingobium sp. B1]|uniref:polysaccharide biosynthesis/export family protein n=1 Tax=Novosphingobium sp. B1 TaxID=1938756 RepID=UPI0009D7AAA5|nr:polysaccharide biosynthesis/export family protein [Novosphingobium sp. B1]SMC96145.1 polysaccharide export outer membrane protein [Novosphingobium sp. B1]